MDQLMPSLAVLLAGLAPAFRREVYELFTQMVGAWIVCLGRRTISRVWETTGQSGTRNHAAAFRLFSQAVWNWDEVCRLLLLTAVAALVPGVRLWVVVDDTLCHKRGAKVAFGGIFLDAVLSTRRHKVFRFGNNWVLLGIVVELPFRTQRYFCLPLLWRVYEKRGTKSRPEHRTKSQLAAEMVRVLAGWLPERKLVVVADSAYIGKHLLKNRPVNVAVVGPVCWRAALYAVRAQPQGRRKRGARLPTPKEMLADDTRWPAAAEKLTFPKGGDRTLALKTITEACWYDVAGPQAVLLVLVRDPQGVWRDEALVSTDVTLTAAEVVTGYCRRWSVEVAFCDAKQQLGFHDPQVWCRESVERAAPLAWFAGTLVVVWYVRAGRDGPQAQRQRPWYRTKESPTFADMLATCRLQLWRHWLGNADTSTSAQREEVWWFLEYAATAA